MGDPAVEEPYGLGSPHPFEVMRTGCGLLAEAIEPLGFGLVDGPRWGMDAGPSGLDPNSGMVGYGRGEEVVAAALANDRVRIDLWLWYRLGPPAYTVDGERLDHDALMRRAAARPHYPPYSPHPLEGFRVLAEDLKAAAGVLARED